MNWAAETEHDMPISPVKSSKNMDWGATDEVVPAARVEAAVKLPEIPEVVGYEFEAPEPVIIEGDNNTFIRHTWTIVTDPKASPEDEDPDEVVMHNIEHMKRTFHKVNRKVAERRKWVKYGESLGDPEGPNRMTTNVSFDDVPIMYTNRRNIINNQTVTLNETEEHELVEARRNVMSQLNNAKLTKAKVPANWQPGEAAPASGISKFKDRIIGKQPAGGAEEPGLRRPGQALARPGRPQTSNYQQEEGCTVRVTNFTENIVETDFNELFSQAGKPKRIYIAKDKKTNKAKGFAYITYERPQEAQKAIMMLNRTKMDHLILNVELSKKEKS